MPPGGIGLILGLLAVLAVTISSTSANKASKHNSLRPNSISGEKFNSSQNQKQSGTVNELPHSIPSSRNAYSERGDGNQKAIAKGHVARKSSSFDWLDHPVGYQLIVICILLVTSFVLAIYLNSASITQNDLEKKLSLSWHVYFEQFLTIREMRRRSAAPDQLEYFAIQPHRWSVGANGLNDRFETLQPALLNHASDTFQTIGGRSQDELIAMSEMSASPYAVTSFGK